MPAMDLRKLLHPANGQPSLPPISPVDENSAPNALDDANASGEYTASNQLTYGHWREEPKSCLELDARLKIVADSFVSYSEVWGYYTPRCGSDEERPRIDRLLVPKQRLLEAGWRLGAIGVEAKASGLKIGPVIAQAMDYARAVFTLPKSHIRVQLSWVFIWPLNTVYGDVASLMANHCIGELKGDNYHTLQFRSTGISMLEFDSRNPATPIVRNLNRGKKVGSR